MTLSLPGRRTVALRARRGARRAGERRPYLGAAALRCALYLGPLAAGVAGSGALARVARPVPVAALVLGWVTAQALTAVGAAVARRAGPSPAARLAGAGFAAAAGLWCALVWLAPPALVGPDRPLATAVGLGALTALATVTAALVTGAERAVIRWSLPCWLLAAATPASAIGLRAPGAAVGYLLPAALVVAAVRAYRPVIGRAVPGRPPLRRADLRSGVTYLVMGAGQAACGALLWHAGPPGATSPAALPLLAAVPVVQALVGWHVREVRRGLDGAGSGAELRAHLRGVTVVTVAGLLPPLAAGGALAAAAYRLPYGLSAVTGARDAVLALAGGTLLGGVLAATFLLAARGRTAAAATLALAAPLATVVARLMLRTPPDPLPAVVAALALTHLLGLLTVAYTGADHRRTS
jgi:hypothetical protein